MDITASNSSFSLSVPSVFGVGQTLQGYATDDAFTQQEVEMGQVMKGVDGIASGAFVPFFFEQSITFQADSPSITNTMEPWWTAQVANNALYVANAVIAIPSIGRKYEFINGFLTRITPAPTAKKILQPMAYQIKWDKCLPSPL